MTPPLPNLRYEKKFVAEGFTLTEVLATVKRHPSAFREVYPPRMVNNIYLDSWSRRDYHDHVNGTPNRTKTRVRWYGPHLDTIERPMLERKQKRGMVSGKEAYSLPRFSINGCPLQAELDAAFDVSLFPPMLRSALRHVEPALFNRYERRYFQSGDRKFRLTVDCRLQFGGVPSERRQAIDLSPPATTLILELKFAPQLAEDADAVTNAWPFRLARFSKYVAGIERI